MWVTLKRDPGKKHWQAIAYYDDERSSLAVRTAMRNIMTEWGDAIELKAVFLHETGCITPDDIRAHDPYWGMQEEEERRDPVHKAAEELLKALKERQREESEAANAHVSYGGQVGGAACRLRKALKEAKK